MQQGHGEHLFSRKSLQSLLPGMLLATLGLEHIFQVHQLPVLSIIRFAFQNKFNAW